MKTILPVLQTKLNYALDEYVNSKPDNYKFSWKTEISADSLQEMLKKLMNKFPMTNVKLYEELAEKFNPKKLPFINKDQAKLMLNEWFEKNEELSKAISDAGDDNYPILINKYLDLKTGDFVRVEELKIEMHDTILWMSLISERKIKSKSDDENIEKIEI